MPGFRRALPSPAALLSALFLAGAVLLLYNGIAAMEYQWRWSRLPRYFFQRVQGEWTAGVLTRGALVTIKISLYAGALAMLIGAAAAAARLLPLPSLRALAWGYVQFMRCTPLLVQVYLLYFMVGAVLGLDRFSAGVLALALFEGAFAAEIFRAGYLAVAQAQQDAAAALGLSRWQRWRLVLLPQALPLVLPPLANLFVSIIKHSSIVTVIAVADLTDAARNLVADTFLAFEVWLCVGALYMLICFPLAWAVRRWEARLRRHAA